MENPGVPQNRFGSGARSLVYEPLEPKGSETGLLLFQIELQQGFLLQFRGSPPAAESLLAQLRGGEGAPSLFPPLLRFGGLGAPPPTAAEVIPGLPPVTSEETPAAALGRLTDYNADR
jgi:hypothetical protein